MKRKTIILALVSGLLALASCNKAELPDMGTIPADNAVRFGVTGITVTTKADVTETLTASLDAGFDVAGFVNGTPDVKMFNELASKNSTWWETATHYYFPLAGTMDFIAAFPSKTGSVITEGVTGVYGIDYLNTENHDLVVATADNVAKTDLVPLTFDHVLSQVIVKMKGSNPDLTYKLTSIGFEVPSEGFYVLRDETGSHAGKVGKWQPSSFIGTDVSSTVIRPIDIASGSFEEVSTADYAKVGDSFVIMPGENVPLSVKWTCEDSAGNVVGEYDETVEIDELVMGKRTTLNVLLPCDATGIRFSAKANAWEDGTKDVSMLPAAKYAVAASEGDTVTLPKLRLDEGTEGCIVWGDGTREEFSNADTKAGSGVSYFVPEHEYTDDFTGDVKLNVKTGKITAARFKDDPSYIIVDEMHAELEPVRALRFTCDEPAYIAFLSLTGRQSLEYSYDGFEWNTWNHIGADLGESILIYISYPEYSLESSIVSAFTEDPLSIGFIACGPDMASHGYPDREYFYVRGSNPEGLCDFNRFYYNQFFCIDASFITNPSEIKTVPVHCEGNIMHLLSYNEDMTEIPCDACFGNLFNCNLTAQQKAIFSLVEAPEMPATKLTMSCYENIYKNNVLLTTAPELPATDLAEYCYCNMFSGCTSLVNAPELPATQLAEACYYGMFSGCTSLVNVPDLPATELAGGCYSHIFSDCTSLANAPDLSATQLAENCYDSMFFGCTSLVNAPELPSTELPEYCYCNMFEGCTSLVNAPELPATNLTDRCYYRMFYGCTSLVNAPELPATQLAEDCYYSMFSDCTSLESVTMKAADVSASYCLAYWLYGAGTSAANPTIYVGPSMFRNPYINSEKGVFTIALLGEPTPGVFTVNNAGKKVKFAPGNLYWNGSGYAFEEHQYDYPDGWDPDHLDWFFWSSSAEVARAASYSDPGRELNDTFFAADGGAIPRWTVLTSDETDYVRGNAVSRRDVEEDFYQYVIDGVNCIILLPDGYTKDILQDTYTADEWAAAEVQYGLVALPFAGWYSGTGVNQTGNDGLYWTCTPAYDYAANSIHWGFDSDINFMYNQGRDRGRSVRLVSVL